MVLLEVREREMKWRVVQQMLLIVDKNYPGCKLFGRPFGFRPLVQCNLTCPEAGLCSWILSGVDLLSRSSSASGFLLQI